MSEEIQGVAKCTFIMFPKGGKSNGGFTIAKFTSLEEGMPRTFSLKGEYFVEIGEEYKVNAVLDEEASKKFADSYNAIGVRKDITLDKSDRLSVSNFLKGIMSESVAESLLNLDDPIEALENQDIDTLTSAKGIGKSKAEKAIDVYFSQKDYTIAFTELAKYDFTPKAIQKIVKHFKSPDQAVKLINENPYVLTQVDGYGFKKADEVFLSGGGDENDTRRVESYIKYLFEEEQDKGNSWLSPQLFIAKVKEFFPTASDEIYRHAGKHVTESDSYVYLDDEYGKRLTSSYMYKMETEILSELGRLMDAECTMDLSDYDKYIKSTEQKNGWDFDENQRQAIDDMVNNNVYMLQGLAGTGKSSLVSGYLNAIVGCGYDYGQAALSGKAADNLTKVTGRQGYTIHTLIKAIPGQEPRHNKENPLPYNVVVLDEISMVNAEIFLKLLQAIKTGSKLIMIGDFGQLDPIGVGVMAGMIKTKVVPMQLLKNIHRQAKDSAIITHSFAMRNGRIPHGLDLSSGRGTYGAIKDLNYVFVNDMFEHEIIDKAIDEFEHRLTKYPVEDIQILCSTKKNGKVSTFDLNIKAQEVYNPLKPNNIGIKKGFGDWEYYIRVGDKVINMKNDKDTLSPDGVSRPIYNGNTGVVKDITYKDEGDHEVTINFDGIGEVVVEGNSLMSIELGYAITVHKSQGSTIKSVIFAMPFHYMLNSRELAYTAMTRASEDLIILTSRKSFKHAIKTTRAEAKQTNLEYLLKDKTKGE